ncbi:MAG: hypothetical protein EON54_28825, partial [Alcaligenaceae bacterium]
YARVNHVFLLPVDPVALNIPHYRQIIKQPMDLGTMTQKLKQGQYGKAIEVRKDFDLMIENCLLFNPVGNPVRDLGIELKREFDQAPFEATGPHFSRECFHPTHHGGLPNHPKTWQQRRSSASERSLSEASGHLNLASRWPPSTESSSWPGKGRRQTKAAGSPHPDQTGPGWRGFGCGWKSHPARYRGWPFPAEVRSPVRKARVPGVRGHSGLSRTASSQCHRHRFWKHAGRRSDRP